ncbi:MAG TPA: hypothetical protein VI759_04585 [Dehalococcoidia bacterium]|nr:hypothetical protein [Dehalococcoidia bacterium]
MPHIVIDLDPPQTDAPSFDGETADLVYFLSWAFSMRYGASHDLSIAALVMRTEYKIDLAPLLTFADRNVEDPADEEALARAWQDAAPLAECCGRVAEALGGNETRLVALQDEYPRLRSNIAALGRIAAWAAEQDARIRVTYELDD